VKIHLTHPDSLAVKELAVLLLGASDIVTSDFTLADKSPHEPPENDLGEAIRNDQTAHEP